MAELDSTQWLVERARQSLKENNPYEAKAWLITAKTLYPKDFGVQVVYKSTFGTSRCVCVIVFEVGSVVFIASIRNFVSLFLFFLHEMLWIISV